MIRIQKYLSDQGICSRREAEDFIKRGLVTVNGVIVEAMGTKIDPDKDTVSILPRAVAALEKKMSIIVNKPHNIASSRAKDEGTTIYDLLPQFRELDIVGRLDKSSEGLLLLSNDGVLARAITGSHHSVEKEYIVRVREIINRPKLKAIEPGIVLGDGPTLPVKVESIDKHSFSIILKEGRKHQIRRMCEYLHLTVVTLKRVRIGAVTILGLKSGEFRVLTAAEVAQFKERQPQQPT